jgi:F-box and WD-40 domain protein CDC4
MNWRRGGRLLRQHRVPASSPETGVITSAALDADWVVVGLANSKIHVYSAKTGVLSRTLLGHDLGVWSVHLVSRGGHCVGNDGSSQGTGHKVAMESGRSNPSISKGGDGQLSDHTYLSSALSGMSLNETRKGSFPTPSSLDHLAPPSLRNALGLDKNPPRTFLKGSSSSEQASEKPDRGDECEEKADNLDPEKKSDVCFASEGWGQPNAIIVSGGCDKVLRVWDVKSG